MYGGSIHHIHPFADAPQAVKRGSSVQRGLVLCRVGPGPALRPPPIAGCRDHHPAGSPPALLEEGGTLLLEVLLSVGDAADGAVGRAFVSRLRRQLLLLPAASVLGQGAAEAASQRPRRRQREREGGCFRGNSQEQLLVCLAQRLGPSGPAVHLRGVEAAVDNAALLRPCPGHGFHGRARGEAGGVKRSRGNLRDQKAAAAHMLCFTLCDTGGMFFLKNVFMFLC